MLICTKYKISRLSLATCSPFSQSRSHYVLSQAMPNGIAQMITLAVVATGNVSCIEAVIVVAVRTAVTPTDTLAGAAWASIQKDIQDIRISSKLGI